MLNKCKGIFTILERNREQKKAVLNTIIYLCVKQNVRILLLAGRIIISSPDSFFFSLFIREYHTSSSIICECNNECRILLNQRKWNIPGKTYTNTVVSTEYGPVIQALIINKSHSSRPRSQRCSADDDGQPVVLNERIPSFLRGCSNLTL